MSSVMTVGQLRASLTLEDDMAAALAKAEKRFKSTAKGMDADAHLGLDTSEYDRAASRIERDPIELPAPERGKFKQGASDAVGEMGTLLVGGLAAAGALAAGAMYDSFSRTLERKHDANKTAVQLGAPEWVAERLGKNSGELYVQGFGESTEQLNEIQKLLIQNVADAAQMPPGTFKDLTSQIATVADIWQKDLGGEGGIVTSIGALLRNGLAPDAQAALDIITRGLQLPADKAHDLLETFNEYSPLFKSLGIDGKTALGLINQGVLGGARNADQVADGLKEFGIRVKDGSDLTEQAFAKLGINADEWNRKGLTPLAHYNVTAKDLANELAKGGDNAAGALQLVTGKLQGIKDPTDKANTSVALFGTLAEDMQGSMDSLDPSKAVESLGKVEGSAKSATDQMGNDGSAKIETFKRQMVEAWDTAINKSAEAAATIWEKHENAINGLVNDNLPKLADFWQTTLPAAVKTSIDIVSGFADNFKATWNIVASRWNGITWPQMGPWTIDTGLPGVPTYQIGPFGGWDIPDLPTFDSGGRIPGSGPKLMIGHGGEYVLPTHRMGLGAAMGAAGLGGGNDYSRHYSFSSSINGAGNPGASATANRRELERMAFYAGVR